jgi:hypothetical protein
MQLLLLDARTVVFVLIVKVMVEMVVVVMMDLLLGI